MNKKITKAVIPAAGLGVRWHPISAYVPKEMFPVGRSPAIEWVVREALAGGSEEIAVIINPRKTIIREYLADRYPEMVEAGAIRFLFQDEPRGLGHAIYLARDFCGENNFAVLLPDDLAWAKPSPPLRRLAGFFDDGVQSVISVTRSARGGWPKNPWNLRRISAGIYVKSSPQAGRQVTLDGFGRYLFRPEFFRYAEETIDRFPRQTISDGMIINLMAEKGKRVLLCRIDNRCFDIGCLPGYAGAVNRYLTRGDPYENPPDQAALRQRRGTAR